MKYIIYDESANTGKNWIDENGHNTVEEDAAKFDTRVEAEEKAQALTTGQVSDWREWASIREVADAH